MKTIFLAMLATLFVASFASPVYAQDAGVAGVTEAPAPAPAPVEAPADKAEEDPLSTLGELVSAVRAGNWRLAIALGLGLLMFAAGKFRDKVKWFSGDRGGAVLVMALALAGAVSTALVSSASLDWKLFLGAAGVAWTAVGGYTWAKRLIWPKDADPESGE